MSLLFQIILGVVLVAIPLGFSWVPLRYWLWKHPTGRCAVSSAAFPNTERVGLIILFIFLSLVTWTLGGKIMSSDEPGAREMLLPVLGGGWSWILFAALFGTHKPTAEAVELRNRIDRIANIRSSRQNRSHAASDRIAIIDGNNLACAKKGEFQLRIVARLCEHLRTQHIQFHVYFDANVGWKATNGSRRMDLEELAQLLNVSQAVISIAPSGVQADPFILGFAEEHSGYVISNDAYRDYSEGFQFLQDRTRTQKYALEGNRMRLEGKRKSFAII